MCGFHYTGSHTLLARRAGLMLHNATHTLACAAVTVANCSMTLHSGRENRSYALVAATRASSPLTKLAESSVENSLASSTASEIATLSGTSSL